MFKGGKEKPAGAINSPDALNKIVEGVSIVGDVKADSNFRIDGVLKGTLESKGKLVIGATGRIEGDVICGNADIEGEFTGNIKVGGLLHLKSTAVINGTVVTDKLAIENGAVFNSTCKMGGNIASKSVTNVVSEPKKEKEEALVY